MEEQKYLDGWYDFGCSKQPQRVPYGMLPRYSYLRFETKEECQAHIDCRKSKNITSLIFN